MSTIECTPRNRCDCKNKKNKQQIIRPYTCRWVCWSLASQSASKLACCCCRLAYIRAFAVISTSTYSAVKAALVCTVLCEFQIALRCNGPRHIQSQPRHDRAGPLPRAPHLPGTPQHCFSAIPQTAWAAQPGLRVQCTPLWWKVQGHKCRRRWLSSRHRHTDNIWPGYVNSSASWAKKTKKWFLVDC